MSDLAGTLFYDDNLAVLREHFDDETVDLIYLDPPFNSNATYNLLYRDESGEASPSQVEVFNDTWRWGEDSERALREMLAPDSLSPPAGVLLNAMVSALGKNSMSAYLAMMVIRLAELRRVLKPHGSIYLHCDPSANAYLRMFMDAIFGVQNFRNEIVWSYRRWSLANFKGFQRMHDTILFYAKDAAQIDFHGDFEPVSESYEQRFRGGSNRKDPENPTRVQRLETPSKGMPRRDVWNDISVIAGSAKERTGFQTQKPLKLLNRIIEASSNEGDLVLDPFCGCGTAVVAAEQLRRRWVGIDIHHLAIGLVEDRLREIGTEASVIGAPRDMAGARDLAQRSRFQFETWAITRLDGFRPNSSQVGDRGVDGVMRFEMPDSAASRGYRIGRAVGQVKSGRAGVSAVRDLIGAMSDADLAVLILMKPPGPRSTMHEVAAAEGVVKVGDTEYPRVQVWSVEDFFQGRLPRLPWPYGREARRML